MTEWIGFGLIGWKNILNKKSKFPESQIFSSTMISYFLKIFKIQDFIYLYKVKVFKETKKALLKCDDKIAFD